MSGGDDAEAFEALPIAHLKVELGEDVGGRVGHKGIEQRCGYPYGLEQIIKDGVEAGLAALVLAEDPGCGLVDIFVGPAQEGEDLGNGVGHLELVHLGLDPFGGLEGQEYKLVVDGILLLADADDAVKILVGHGYRAVDKVSEDVGQVGIDTLDKQLVGQSAVAGKRDVMEQIIADGVKAVKLYQIVGVKDVAL